MPRGPPGKRRSQDLRTDGSSALTSGPGFRRTVFFRLRTVDLNPEGGGTSLRSDRMSHRLLARMHSFTRGVMARLTVSSTLGAIITLMRPTVVGRIPLTVRGRSSRWR
jgi:hypothetical protein